MVEAFSILGLMIIVILITFFSKIMHVIARIAFVALLAAFVLILLFGISFNQIIDWGLSMLLLVL